MEDEETPQKKKAKATPPKRAKGKPKPSSKPPMSSPDESSDDDVPLRPGPSDRDIKSAILQFLKGKDLATVTKGMVKDDLRSKYGETIVKTKREVIAQGIQEGMASL